MVRESSHTHHLHARAVGSALVYSNRPAGSNSARRRALRVEELTDPRNQSHPLPSPQTKEEKRRDFAREKISSAYALPSRHALSLWESRVNAVESMRSGRGKEILSLMEIYRQVQRSIETRSDHESISSRSTRSDRTNSLLLPASLRL